MVGFLESLTKTLDMLVTPVKLPSYDDHVILSDTIRETLNAAEQATWVEAEYAAILESLAEEAPDRSLITKALMLKFELLANEHLGDVNLLFGSSKNSAWGRTWQKRFDTYVEKSITFLEEFAAELNVGGHHLTPDAVLIIKDMPNKFKWLMKSDILRTDHIIIQLDTRLPLLTRMTIQRLTDVLLSVQVAIAEVSINI